MPTLRRAFGQQRDNAKQRGIPWHLSYDAWLRIWRESGKMEKRGRGRGKYAMCRKWDTGPYAEWNVYIDEFTQNVSDANRRFGRPRKPLDSTQVKS